VKLTLQKSLVIAFASALLASSCFGAEDQADPKATGTPAKTTAPKEEKEKKTPKQLISSSIGTSEKPIPRIWIGLTGSITPLKLIKGNTGIQDSNGSIFSSKSANGQLGGGAILNVRLYRGFGISLGSIYRFTGYDATATLNDLNGTTNVERTRVRLLDFPVMIRYSGRKFNPSKRTFYELGGVMREGMSIKTTTNSIDQVTGELGAGPVTGTRYKHQVFGAVAGAGLIGRDDFGIIVSPEVRYTRWFGETFNSPLVGSQKNQLEFTVSFGF
jgi:hypothetical protein